MPKKTKHSKPLAIPKHWSPLTFALLAIVTIMAGYLLVNLSHGASTVFYLSPSGATIAQNDTFVVDVRLDTGGESVNAVQANLSYPADKLDLVNITDVGSAFKTQAESQGGSGSIRLARSTTGGSTPVVGDVLVASIYFKAKVSAGSAAVVFAAGSGVARSNGDGVNILSGTRGGNYFFQAAPTPTPPPAISPTPPAAPAPISSPSPMSSARPANTPTTATTKPVSSALSPTPTPRAPLTTSPAASVTSAPVGPASPTTDARLQNNYLAAYIKPVAVGSLTMLLVVMGILGALMLQQPGASHHSAKSAARSIEPIASPTVYPDTIEPKSDQLDDSSGSS